MASSNHEAYRNAVRQAWPITPESAAMLEALRRALGITGEEHQLIERELAEQSRPAPPPPPPPPSQPDAPGDCLKLGKNAYHSGDYKRALEMCDQVLCVNPSDSEALFFRKRALSKMADGAEPADVKSGDLLFTVPAVKPPCGSCRGSGKCYWCKGTGRCYWCSGTGLRGGVRCESCKATGSCRWCGATGACPKCA